MNSDKLLSTVRFDPFLDRRSRDIRNLLSETFIHSLKIMDTVLFESTVRNLIAERPVKPYYDYITQRVAIYRRVFDQIQRDGIIEPSGQAVILWNHTLFFEVHELLEEIWQRADGPLRQALKGLIQAAGVYVHLERDNHRAAAGLAARALKHLEAAGEHLTFIDGLEGLLGKLERLEMPPPCLRPVKDHENKA